MMLSRTGWGETSLPVAFQTVGGRRAPWGCAAGAPYRGTASPPPPPLCVCCSSLVTAADDLTVLFFCVVVVCCAVCYGLSVFVLHKNDTNSCKLFEFRTNVVRNS